VLVRGRLAVTVAAVAAGVAGVAGVAGGVAAGCSPGRSTHATIMVDAPVSLADQPLHIRVTGLVPHDEVTVGSQADDYRKRKWHAQARFAADGHGVIDLDRARATTGSYSGVDGMGLFWSMSPPDGNPDQQRYVPPSPDQQPTSGVQIAVTGHGRTLATRTLTRQWLAAGVTTRAVTLAADKVAGRLFLPPAGAVRHPPVLVFGGSEGGMSQTFTAALLASHGHPTLTVAYFHEPGLPATLRDIPLEYFATAARVLAGQPGVDPAHLIVMGYSRGTEAALLLAQDFPTLVHGAVLYAPSAVVHFGFPDISSNAWTLAGAPVPQIMIPVDHVSGPVLAVAGADDALWPSATAASLIMRNLDDVHDRYPHQALVYPHAGHGVGTFPYAAQGTSLVHPVTGTLTRLGGTRSGSATAQAQGWPKVLALLASLQP
jgi:dienelactone hydrolase